MRFRHRGFGFVFFVFVIVFAAFIGIAYAADPDFMKTDGALAVFAAAGILSTVLSVLLRLLLEYRLGRERADRIERVFDLVFLIAVALPCFILTVWMWTHSMFG